jgi:very-short-patch-repair endonuclease
MSNKRDIDARIAEVARRQYGLVTSRQLEMAGLARSAISYRVGRARLHRVQRGVYAVGHSGLSDAARWMAAVLAMGDGAALSHASAAAHWGLLRPLRGPVDVSVTTRGGRRARAGIRVHRRPGLEAVDLTCYKEIPVTTPARTVADLTKAVPPRLARRARRQAEMLGLSLDDPGSDRTRSDLERDFLRFCRLHGLPTPEVNIRVGRWVVDFLWRPQHLVVETDFYGYHRGSVAFEDDRQRDLELRRLGYAVHRYTGAQLHRHPAEIAAELDEILRQGRRPS